MVRLHTSLIALTFATGLVLASSDDYQRRDDELFERDFDAEEFFQRSSYDLLNERGDTYDEPEARSLFGDLFKVGEKVGEKALKGRVGTIMKVAKTASKLEHHGGSAKKIEKRLGSVRKVEKNLKPSKRIVKVAAKQLKPSKKRVVKELKRAAKQANKNNNDNRNKSNQKRINEDLQRAMKEVADADRYLPANHQYHVQARGLEDDEELSQRDLADAEEMFGREYDDLFFERDTFDDLD